MQFDPAIIERNAQNSGVKKNIELLEAQREITIGLRKLGKKSIPIKYYEQLINELIINLTKT